jgi:hypothetical protein
VKTAPHFGHLIFASFDIPAHPKEKTDNIANAKKMLTHFFITPHLLSSMNEYKNTSRKLILKSFI